MAQSSPTCRPFGALILEPRYTTPWPPPRMRAPTWNRGPSAAFASDKVNVACVNTRYSRTEWREKGHDVAVAPIPSRLPFYSHVGQNTKAFFVLGQWHEEATRV